MFAYELLLPVTIGTVVGAAIWWKFLRAPR